MTIGNTVPTSCMYFAPQLVEVMLTGVQGNKFKLHSCARCSSSTTTKKLLESHALQELLITSGRSALAGLQVKPVVIEPTSIVTKNPPARTTKRVQPFQLLNPLSNT